jgi:hypothetical protein
VRYDFTKHRAECAEYFFCRVYAPLAAAGVYFHWTKVATVFRRTDESEEAFRNRAVLALNLWTHDQRTARSPGQFRMRFRDYPTDVDGTTDTEGFHAG